MSVSNLIPLSSRLKQITKTSFGAAFIVVFSGMSALAFDGETRGECYDYVIAGCNEDPPCTVEETNILLDSCDEYPESVKTPRPSFTAKQPSSAVVKSAKYKLKIKQLRADIRRK